MNKLHASIFAGSCLFVLAFATGILGMTESIGQYARSDRSDWMKVLSDDTAIADMNIPGTHNTLARYGVADLSGQCQSLDLEQQLKIGVRFLDVRLQISGNSLRAYHNFIDQKLTFQTAVKTMEKFLDEHPGETLLVSIKEETVVNASESFEDYLREYFHEGRWYLEQTMPETLGQVRGKMVLLSRYKNSTIGIPADSSWRDNASFALSDDIYVQDHYELKDIETKKSDILQCFEAEYPYRINFLSGYLDGTFPPSFAVSVAEGINAWAKSTLPMIERKGIVLFDFVTTELVDSIFEVPA